MKFQNLLKYVIANKKIFLTIYLIGAVVVGVLSFSLFTALGGFMGGDPNMPNVIIAVVLVPVFWPVVILVYLIWLVGSLLFGWR